MKHYVEKVQKPEFSATEKSYTFVSHQQTSAGTLMA
jgi:isocitrate lyase